MVKAFDGRISPGLINDLGGWRMALGRRGDLVVTWQEMPRSLGHVFYDRLQEVLIDAGLTLSRRRPASGTIRRRWARRRFRPAGTSGCTWATLRGSTASAGEWQGGMRRRAARGAIVAHNLERGGMRRTWQ